MRALTLVATTGAQQKTTNNGMESCILSVLVAHNAELSLAVVIVMIIGVVRIMNEDPFCLLPVNRRGA